ncbi:DUF6941 family protein [Frigidibacter sp. MR17.24]|uniref:DUF6941 family protein n=1 Tax=Frigidibacter sp. MR17.24 TaxID=3127345 RepID=UPI003012EB88
MAVAFEAAILCDDIRQEVNGKQILIGAYTGNIIFSGFPAAGQFFVFAKTESLPVGQHSLSVRLRFANKDIGTVQGEVSIETQGGLWLPLNTPPISFPGEGELEAQYIDSEGKWITFLSIPIRGGQVPGT